VTVKSPIDVGKSSTTGSWWDAMSAMDYNTPSKTAFATLKSPIDASNSSNTIKLFLKYTDVLYMTNYDIIYI
jgi:hypothetical protein